MNFSEKNFPFIQSRDNQKLKSARAVRDGRERHKIFVEGLRLCEEISQTDLKIESVFFTSEFIDSERGRKLIADLSVKNFDVNRVDERLLATLADTKTSQGIVIIAEKPRNGRDVIENNAAENALFLLLHKVNNPSNLGAILRTAAAGGAAGIITTRGTADIFSPKSLRGAMGAAFRLPVWSNADFFEALEWAGEKGIKTVCADIKSEKNYTELNWNEAKLLIFGSEGHGLTETEMTSTNESLKISMENEVESLNVAVACGVILFEAKRQRDSYKTNNSIL